MKANTHEIQIIDSAERLTLAGGRPLSLLCRLRQVSSVLSRNCRNEPWSDAHAAQFAAANFMARRLHRHDGYHLGEKNERTLEGGHHRRWIWWACCGPALELKSGGGDAYRSTELSSLPTTTLSSRDGFSFGRRGRIAPSERSKPAEKYSSLVGDCRGHRSGFETRLSGRWGHGSLRFIDRCRRLADILLRAQRVARVGARHEECQRSYGHPPQNSLCIRSGRAPFGSLAAPRLAHIRHRWSRAHWR